MEKPKLIDINEFREAGYLQELNRRFLHPLGLAMSVNINEDGSSSLGGVWDYRDDPEGMHYLLSDTSKEKFKRKSDGIDKEWAEKEKSRGELLGYMIQPLE